MATLERHWAEKRGDSDLDSTGSGVKDRVAKFLRSQSLATYAAVSILVLALAGLAWFSHRLAGIRIYQVDECTEVYVAKLLTDAAQRGATGNVSLFQIGLSWLARGASQSVDLFVSARFVMLEIFWLNLVLIALATGQRLLSRGGLVALLGAATLAPLWDYGFEIRHDNLLLTGLLLTWCAVRVRPSGLQSYLIAGAIAVGLQFVAFKAFVYTIPLSVAVLVFPPLGHRAPRWKLALAWLLGAVGALVILRLTYGAMGLWEGLVGGAQTTAHVSAEGSRFGAWFPLGRLLGQTPLLLALLASGLVALGAEWQRRGRAMLSWEGSMPEALLLAIAFGALLINPTPFPYNLVNLVPFMFLFVFRHAIELAQTLQARPGLLPVAASVVVFAHLVPFGLATQRHLAHTNFHQEAVMRLAEGMTDPVRDPVFDGVGMVHTRPVISPHAFLHSLSIAAFISGRETPVREMLKARPAAVILQNYRTDWLPEADQAFIRERYVSLADDFWVLGKVLPKGGGSFEIVQPGRYRISTLEGSDLAGTYAEGFAGLLAPEVDGSLAGTLDGVPLSKGSVALTVGTHRLETAGDSQVAVVWMGPSLQRVGRLGPSDRRQLFVNWY